MNFVLPLTVLTMGTLAFRLAGPVLRSRTTISPRTERLTSVAVAVVFVALIATSLVVDNGFAGFACLAGVLVAAILAWLKVPFVAIVLAAATTTAALRFLGVA